MSQRIVFLLFCLALTGCPTREPVTVQGEYPDRPDVVFTQAAKVLALMGATLTHSDRSAGVLSGTLANGVNLGVVLTAQESGTLVAVTGVLPSNKLAVGSLDEPGQFLRLLLPGKALVRSER